jgi:hypothetical protein
MKKSGRLGDIAGSVMVYVILLDNEFVGGVPRLLRREELCDTCLQTNASPSSCGSTPLYVVAQSTCACLTPLCLYVDGALITHLPHAYWCFLAL